MLLYELLTGLPPHYNQNRLKMYEDIVNKKVSFPRSLSKDATDILKRMLEKDPAKRISIE